MTEQPVYIDSNVFLFPVIHAEEQPQGNKKVTKVSKSKEILEKIEKEKLVAYTSRLTWDEVTWVVLRTMGEANSLEVGRKLLNFPNLRFVDVGEPVIACAQQIREKYELDPRDAIHCASAIYRNLKTVISDDPHLDKCAVLKRVSLEDF